MQSQVDTRLKRSSQERILGGVCGGLAQYFEVDPTIVRLVFVALACIGVGVLLYLVLWIIMPGDAHVGAAGAVQPGPGARFDPMTGAPLPGEPGAAASQQAPAAGPAGAGQRRPLLGLVLVGLGVFIALQMMMPWASEFILPTLLIGAGLVLISQRRARTP